MDISGHPVASGSQAADSSPVRRTLLNPDPEPTGGPGAPSGQRTEPAAAPTSASPPVVPAPPAAQTVIQGEVTEENLRLKEQLAEKDRLLKQRETEVSETQRQVQTLKEAIEQPKPVPVKKKPAEAKPEAKPFRIGRFV